jgi:uncharacterized protein (TIGR03000 family)
MKTHRLALLAVFVLATLQGTGQETPSKTMLKVLLPQKRGRVMVDGKAVSVRGTTTREFDAPALPAGKKEHEVTVTWRANDYTRFYRTAKVAPKPGATVTVDLTRPDPKAPDRIEIRFVPTPEDVVERMCKLAKIGKGDVVYDLGCGDGRMVIMGVKDFGAKRGVGVDLDPDRVEESKEYAKKAGIAEKLEFRVGDVLDIKDLSDASVVMLYMGDDVNLRLRPILLKTLKPGSRIVSHRFKMGDWVPDKTEKFDAADGDEYEIHVWTVGKK